MAKILTHTKNSPLIRKQDKKPNGHCHVYNISRFKNKIQNSISYFSTSLIKLLYITSLPTISLQPPTIRK